MKIRILFNLLSVALIAATSPLQAGLVITSGSATLTINEGQADSISNFNAYFDELTTRSNILGLAAPGNKPFVDSGASVQLSDPIRPFGATPPSGLGRTPQLTTLQIENGTNVLGSWQSSADLGLFVGSNASEQIAFTSMQRYTGPFTGTLVYGDFALRYVSGRVGLVRDGNTLSGLVLTSNIDFANAAFADIGNASINITNNQLLIGGDLLISNGLLALDPSATLGKNFGEFSMVANLAAVPEPSSMLLVVLPAVGLAWGRRRRAQSVRGALS